MEERNTVMKHGHLRTKQQRQAEYEGELLFKPQLVTRGHNTRNGSLEREPSCKREQTSHLLAFHERLKAEKARRKINKERQE
jgi:hypothetical protein